jgi:glycine cleavage system T protein (aminomethyltransferase)
VAADLLMGDELKRTPLYEEHLALGAHMTPFKGWEMPAQYSGIIEEHQAVRDSAGVFDLCYAAELRVFGFSAFDFLQRMLTNDLHAIAELGQAQHTLMLDDDGHIIDDPVVYHTGDLEYMIVADGGGRETDLAWLVEHAPKDLEIADESDRTALIALEGPEALRIVSELAGEGWQPPARLAIAEAMLGTIPALIARTGCTGEDGVEMVTGARHAAALWRAILSFPEVTPVGLLARDVLRLEAGHPSYGVDIDRTVDPVSAGLDRLVPRDKRGFVGAETLERIRAEGPAMRLVGVRVEHGTPQPGFVVLREGVVVGKVASGAHSPTLEAGIATAYVPAELSRPGTPLGIEIQRKVVSATVVALPFVTGTSLSA